MSTLREIFEHGYRRHSVRPCTSDRSNTLWHQAFRHFARSLGHEPRLSDLTDERLQEFVAFRMADNVTTRTINRDLSCLLAIWRFCHQHRLVDDLPELRLLPEQPSVSPAAWDADQMRRLFRAVRGLEGTVPGTDIDASDWWAALILATLDTGQRLGRLLTVTWPDVDLQARCMTFRLSRGRTSTANIGQDTAEELSRFAGRHVRVFHHDACRTYPNDYLAAILRRAGLPADRSRKFESIRVTASRHSLAPRPSRELTEVRHG